MLSAVKPVRRAALMRCRALAAITAMCDQLGTTE